MQALKDNHPKFLRRGSIRVVVVFRAFSLLEVVVCVAILALLGGIAAPRIAASNAKARVESAARVAAAVIDRAATQAECSGTSCTVRFRKGSVIEVIRSDGVELLRFDGSAEPWRCEMIEAEFGGDAEMNIDGFGESDTDGWFDVRSSEFIIRVDWNGSKRCCEIGELSIDGDRGS